MEKEYKIGAVIVAAGSGLRFGEKKQFKMLGPQPLYLYSLQKFIDCNLIDEIMLIVPKDLLKLISCEMTTLNHNIKVVKGGKSRQDSVSAGINNLSPECKIVCVHDAARPFISSELIHRTIDACKTNDGAIAAMPANDTVKEVNTDTNRIKRTMPRENIWLAQTPQAFNRTQLKKALLYAKEHKIQATDEATLMEKLNYNIVVVEGNSDNFKITTQGDWKLAELMLEKKHD
jgi:2-C-methyl-D-erythritol 4-phosphate cytidylyltransferase